MWNARRGWKSARVTTQGWAGLFTTAFRESRNAICSSTPRTRSFTLVDARRTALLGRPLWELVVGGPQLTAEEYVSCVAPLHRRDAAAVR